MKRVASVPRPVLLYETEEASRQPHPDRRPEFRPGITLLFSFPHDTSRERAECAVVW